MSWSDTVWRTGEGRQAMKIQYKEQSKLWIVWKILSEDRRNFWVRCKVIEKSVEWTTERRLVCSLRILKPQPIN
jgi:hypothetical protein